eukprot:Em0020g566a
MNSCKSISAGLGLVRRFISTCTRQDTSTRVGIVGSGPAGFYTAHHLIKHNSKLHVDIFDRLPIPFGLVRYGVAPDHPDVKNVINQFSALAESDRCRFIGNVSLGKDITLAQLQPFYHALVLAYGADDDTLLRVPGEDLGGVLSARAFVGWYNGLPEHAHLNPDLSGDTAVIIGQGNVAIDVARMLLTPISILETQPGTEGGGEFREMTKLPECRALLDRADFEEVRDIAADTPRPRKRLTELLVKTADAVGSEPCAGSSKEWGLRFLRSPVEFVCDEQRRKVAGVKMEINKLEGEPLSARAVGTGHFEIMDCSLALRSIGYKTKPVDKDVPFDPKGGIIPNMNGYVSTGLYCSGWVKTGPIGVILSTMNDAFETADTILNDLQCGNLATPSDNGDVLELLSALPGLHPTSFSDWKLIDQFEQLHGRPKGKPREKVTSHEMMMDIIRTQSAQH